MAEAETESYVCIGQPSKDVARNMSATHFKQLTIMAVGILTVALWAEQTRPLAAQSLTLPYPWCSVGESVHCDFDTLAQCEETVDYHGFCEQNPDPPARVTGQGSAQRPAHHNTAGRRAYPQ